KHQLQLESSISVHAGGMDLALAEAGGKQNNIRAKIEFDSEFKQQSQALLQESDPEKITKISEQMQNAVHNGTFGGVFSYEKGKTYSKAIDGIIEYHEHINTMLRDGHVDAKQYATMRSIAYGDQDGAGQPIDQTTQHFYDTNNNHVTFEDAKAASVIGDFPNLNNLSQLTEPEQQKIQDIYLGARDAQGAIKANSHTPEMKLRYDR